MKQVQWTKGGVRGDDFTAIVGDYTLRAEQMDRNYWWWCVYYKDDRIDEACHHPLIKTRNGAKRKATTGMLKHLKTNKI